MSLQPNVYPQSNIGKSYSLPPNQEYNTFDANQYFTGSGCNEFECEEIDIYKCLRWLT